MKWCVERSVACSVPIPVACGVEYCMQCMSLHLYMWHAVSSTCGVSSGEVLVIGRDLVVHIAVTMVSKDVSWSETLSQRPVAVCNFFTNTTDMLLHKHTSIHAQE